MCTVTYVPFKEGFAITSNRDENPARKTAAPKIVKLNNKVIVEAPIDAKQGGTWIALEKQTGNMVCLLNGAHKKHKRSSAYRKSRGKIVLEVFLSKNFETFCEEVYLEGIEPFTLLMANKKLLIELIWNGKTKEINLKNNKAAYIWSSSTLYNDEEKDAKAQLFKNYLQAQKPTPEILLELHGVSGRNDFILNGKIMKTLSITQMVSLANETNMKYFDLAAKQKAETA